MIVGVPHSRVYEPAENGILSPENRKYLEKVLRLKKGDRFFLTCGDGFEIEAVLENGGSYSCSQKSTPGREPALRLVLFAPVIKGDRFEFLIEKAIELGVSKIVPIICRHSVVGLPSEQKMRRWEKIAIGAMLQCGGCVKPEIASACAFDQLPGPDKNVIAVFLHEVPGDEPGRVPDFPPLKKDGEIWLSSGPEGGFADSEVEKFRQNGWLSFWLGKRLLRADTAPIAAISAILIPRVPVSCDE